MFRFCVFFCAFGVPQLWAKPIVFDHKFHESQAKKKEQPWNCIDCHGDIDVSDTQRPAQKNHEACSASGCHAQEFYGSDQAQRPICTLCHTNDQAWADMRQLRPFPSHEDGQRTYCINFSHRQHLEKKHQQKTCLNCHKLAADKVTYMGPSHGDCMTCHTPENVLPMSQCTGCHEMGSANGQLQQCSPKLPWRSRQMRTRFSHDTHRVDITKKDHPPLSCGQCHRGAHRATNVRNIRLFYGFGSMQSSCGRCHNGRIKVPGENRRVFSTNSEKYCGKCHGNKFSSMAAPKGH